MNKQELIDSIVEAAVKTEAEIRAMSMAELLHYINQLQNFKDEIRRELDYLLMEENEVR